MNIVVGEDVGEVLTQVGCVVIAIARRVKRNFPGRASERCRVKWALTRIVCVRFYDDIPVNGAS